MAVLIAERTVVARDIGVTSACEVAASEVGRAVRFSGAVRGGRAVAGWAVSHPRHLIAGS